VGSPTCSTLRHSNEVERLSTGGKQLPQSAVSVVAMGGSAETSYHSAQAVSQWARPDVELPRTATVAVVCHTSAHRTPFLLGSWPDGLCGSETSVALRPLWLCDLCGSATSVALRWEKVDGRSAHPYHQARGGNSCTRDSLWGLSYLYNSYHATGSSSLWAAPQKQVTVALRTCRSGHVLM